MPKTKSPTAPKTQTKASYVLALPQSMPAKDVVAKAKTAGVSLSTAHIYAIRSDAKRRSARKSSAPKRAAHVVSTGPTKDHHVGGHKTEDLLKAVASELGLSHAMSVLKAEHDRVHRILGS